MYCLSEVSTEYFRCPQEHAQGRKKKKANVASRVKLILTKSCKNRYSQVIFHCALTGWGNGKWVTDWQEKEQRKETRGLHG